MVVSVAVVASSSGGLLPSPPAIEEVVQTFSLQPLQSLHRQAAALMIKQGQNIIDQRKGDQATVRAERRRRANQANHRGRWNHLPPDRHLPNPQVDRGAWFRD
jgi:hypothetical protein